MTMRQWGGVFTLSAAAILGVSGAHAQTIGPITQSPNDVGPTPTVAGPTPADVGPTPTGVAPPPTGAGPAPTAGAEISGGNAAIAAYGGVVVPDSVAKAKAAAKKLGPGVNANSVANFREYSLTASADLEEIFTTNAYATSPNSGNGIGANTNSPYNKKADVDNRVSASLVGAVNEARFTAALSNTIAGDFYDRYSALNRVTDNLALVTTTQLVPNLLTFDARAYSTPVNETNLGPIAVGQRALPGGINGYSDSIGYSLGPTLTNRFGDFASSVLKLTDGATFFLNHQSVVADTGINQTPQTTRVFDANEELKSGPDFNQLQWSVNADTTQSSGGADLKNTTGGGELDYALNHYLTLIAKGGYDSIGSNQALVRSLDDPYWAGGFRLLFLRDLTFHLEAGRRYGRPSLTGDLSYAIGAFTFLSAGLTDTVTTPALGVFNNLNNLTATTLNNSVLPNDQLQLNNSVNRVQALNAALTRKTERTTLQLAVYGTQQQTLNQIAAQQTPNQTSVGTELTFSHQLTRLLTATANAGYSIQRGQLEIRDKVMNGGVSLAYALGPKTSLAFGATYLARVEDEPPIIQLLQNSPEGGNLRDAEISVTLHRQF